MQNFSTRQNATLQLARTDDQLAKVLAENLKTPDLCNVDHSPRVLQAHELAEWGLATARLDYDESPDRLKFVVSPSATPNALAVWGRAKADWIVLSEGLLDLLQEGANTTAAFLSEHQHWLFETATIRDMQKAGNLAGLHSPMASFLYFAAVTFFVGHEAGHHVLGHDGHFRGGVHTEAVNQEPVTPSEAQLATQALEYTADEYGVMIARNAMIRWLFQFVEARTYTVVEQASFQYVVAVAMSLGVHMANTLITPRPVDWNETVCRSHPPGTMRMVYLSNTLMSSISENFGRLGPEQINDIRYFAIGVAAKFALPEETPTRKKTPERKLYEERLPREGEFAALRAVGLRQIMYDQQAKEHAQEHARKIEQKYREVFPSLRPRSRKFLRGPQE